MFFTDYSMLSQLKVYCLIMYVHIRFFKYFLCHFEHLNIYIFNIIPECPLTNAFKGEGEKMLTNSVDNDQLKKYK